MRKVVIHVLGKENGSRQGSYPITSEVTTIFSSVEVGQKFQYWCGRTKDGEHQDSYRRVSNSAEVLAPGENREYDEKVLVSGVIIQKWVEVNPDFVVLHIDLN